MAKSSSQGIKTTSCCAPGAVSTCTAQFTHLTRRSAVHTTRLYTTRLFHTHRNRDLTHDVENRTSGTSDATRQILSSHTLSHTVIPVPPTTVRRYVTRDPQDSAAFTSSPHRTTTIPRATRFDPTTSTPSRKLRHNSAVHTTQLRCSHSAASHTHSAVPHNSAVHTRACTVAFRLDSLGTGRANGDTHRDGRVWSHFGVAFPKHVLEGEALGDFGQALS